MLEGFFEQEGADSTSQLTDIKRGTAGGIHIYRKLPLLQNQSSV